MSGGRAVVVLHELFGVSDHVREVCERLRGAGHRVEAPDLYAPLGQSGPLSEDAEGRDRGFALLARLRVADVAAAIEGAADRLEAPTVGVLGLSAGGYLALRVAAAHPARIDRVVAVYPGWVDTADNPLGDGVRLADALLGLEVPALAITGDQDALIRGTSASLLGAAATPLRARVLPRAEHGFLARHRPSHEVRATEAAWGLILEGLA